MKAHLRITDSNVIPLRPEDGHQVHLDASEMVSRGIKATCTCGVVVEPLRGAHEVLQFLRNHRGDDAQE